MLVYVGPVENFIGLDRPIILVSLGLSRENPALNYSAITRCTYLLCIVAPDAEIAFAIGHYQIGQAHHGIVPHSQNES